MKKSILVSVSDDTLQDLDRIATICKEFIGAKPNRSRAIRIATTVWINNYKEAKKKVINQCTNEALARD